MDAKNKQPNHLDRLQQEILPGQPIAFSHSYSSGINIGTVAKLTKQRVRIAYKHIYHDRNGERHTYNWYYLARPERTLVLTTELPQHLTLATLKGQL